MIRVYGVTECIAEPDDPAPGTGGPCLVVGTPLPGSVRTLLGKAPASDGTVSWSWTVETGCNVGLAYDPDRPAYHAIVLAAYNASGRSIFAIAEPVGGMRPLLTKSSADPLEPGRPGWAGCTATGCAYRPELWPPRCIRLAAFQTKIAPATGATDVSRKSRTRPPHDGAPIPIAHEAMKIATPVKATAPASKAIASNLSATTATLRPVTFSISTSRTCEARGRYATGRPAARSVATVSRMTLDRGSGTRRVNGQRWPSVPIVVVGHFADPRAADCRLRAR